MRVQQLAGALSRLAAEHPNLPEPHMVSLWPDDLTVRVQLPTLAAVMAWATVVRDGDPAPDVIEVGRQLVTRVTFEREAVTFRVFCAVVTPAEGVAHRG